MSSSKTIMERFKRVFQRLNSSATPADYFLGITMVASLLTANTAILTAMAISSLTVNTDIASVQSSSDK